MDWRIYMACLSSLMTLSMSCAATSTAHWNMCSWIRWSRSICWCSWCWFVVSFLEPLDCCLLISTPWREQRTLILLLIATLNFSACEKRISWCIIFPLHQSRTRKHNPDFWDSGPSILSNNSCVRLIFVCLFRLGCWKVRKCPLNAVCLFCLSCLRFVLGVCLVLSIIVVVCV